jgi:hypothetical protein
MDKHFVKVCSSVVPDFIDCETFMNSNSIQNSLHLKR